MSVVVLETQTAEGWRHLCAHPFHTGDLAPEVTVCPTCKTTEHWAFAGYYDPPSTSASDWFAAEAEVRATAEARRAAVRRAALAYVHEIRARIGLRSPAAWCLTCGWRVDHCSLDEVKARRDAHLIFTHVGGGYVRHHWQHCSGCNAVRRQGGGPAPSPRDSLAVNQQRRIAGALTLPAIEALELETNTSLREAVMRAERAERSAHLDEDAAYE